MSRFEQLTEITRNGSLEPHELQKHFLQYASLCADEESVYAFMERHRYGIDSPDFWMARYHYAFRVRNLRKSYQYIRKARRVAWRKKEQSANIKSQEQKLWEYLKVVVNLQADNDDPLEQIDMDFKSEFIAERHQCKKIGKLLVYIDPENRGGSLIETLIEEYDHRCKEQKEYQISKFESIQSRKPTSWLFQSSELAATISEEVVTEGDYENLSQDSTNWMPEKYNNLATPAKKEDELIKHSSFVALDSSKFSFSAGSILRFHQYSHQYMKCETRTINYQNLSQQIEVFRQMENPNDEAALFGSLENARIQQSQITIETSKGDLEEIIKQAQIEKQNQRQRMLNFSTRHKTNVHESCEGQRTPTRQKDPLETEMDSLNKMLEKYNSLSPCNIGQLFELLDKESQSGESSWQGEGERRVQEEKCSYGQDRGSHDSQTKRCIG